MLNFLRHRSSQHPDPSLFETVEADLSAGMLTTAAWANGAASASATALRKAIASLDDHLSAHYGVAPYHTDSRCLFRLAVAFAESDLVLSDGQAIKAGAAIAELHLWNDHVPLLPRNGPDLTWGRLLSRRIRLSLRLLAIALETDPALRTIVACRAMTNFLGLHHTGESLTHLIRRLGFEEVDEGVASMPVRIHDAFENILIAALVWTHNPHALRRDKLIRQRRPVWISRQRLLLLHGPHARV